MIHAATRTITKQHEQSAVVKHAALREIRVLQVFSVLGMGGAETWLMSLLKYFHDTRELPVKVSFDVLLTGGEKAVFDDQAVALGAKLFYAPFNRRHVLAFVRGFRRILAEGNYDAIHDHQDYISGLHFAIGGRLLPRVRIAHVHNPLYHRGNYANGFARRKSLSAGKYLLGRHATHIMGTSRQILTEYGFDGFADRGITVGAAHCGFDVTRYRGDSLAAHAAVCREFGWPESAKIILFVGRLDGAEIMHHGRLMSHKNPALALDIARECISRDDDIRLLMVGSGEAKTEFEAKVRGWGLEDQIRLTGQRSDVPRLMLGANLLLFPSLAEGLGMVVVEAQAAGLPVLASDTTPRECVVVPGMVSFLSLDADAAQWADESLRLTGLRRCASRQSNDAVRDSAFSIENSAAQLLDLYDSHQ